ncbi:ABC transporter ATP-binding protein [Candidatus Poriferisodalis sp.]|uniref:ABC transporter ATP-binding protein n=1 Tax=Candidatus Poriferisodalis sp. TaxID=3101277 RepID=UPI003D0EEEA9
MTALLEVDDLHVTFNPPTGPVRAVRGVSLQVQRGEILGVVGESGCGKTVLFRALLGLLPASAAVSGAMRLSGEAIPTDGTLQGGASLVYQNPGAALNPVFTIGRQLQLVAGTRAPEVLCGLLAEVGLAEPERLLDAYPHEFSGGMRQRAVIALALAQQPQLLIADEPTTALDVTTQAQVLDLIADLRDRLQLAVVLISHDLAAIRRVCDRVMVLYAGRIAETGTTSQVLGNPTHPYTQALLESVPRPEAVGGELASIPGSVPDGRAEITGCAFAPRCLYAHDACRADQPALRPAQPGHTAACVLTKMPT